MAPVFKRVSALNSSSPSKATGLIPVDDPAYNYGRSGKVLESLVYTSSGTFSQIIAPSNVEREPLRVPLNRPSMYPSTRMRMEPS